MEAAALPDSRGAFPADCWQRLFGNAHPVGIEVGPGRGEFLRAVARARPAWNFYAIERSASRAAYVAGVLADAGLDNARVVWADATCLLPLLPAGSAAGVYVQFPDPWWKRRHFKRRIWTPQLAAAIAHVLAPGAQLEFLTDVEETLRLGTAQLDALLALERVNVGPVDRHDTDFARKALRRGATLYRAVYRRR
jgi:tRNA (guanine-N7-)-methyltransferase